MKIHVRDSAGKEVLAQAVDTDYDDYHKPDMLIFQADFRPERNQNLHPDCRGKARIREGRLSCLWPLRARAF